VRRIATISPIQFSALKVLNPLDDEDEHGEDDDRQADVEEIRHHSSCRRNVLRTHQNPGHRG
jgi:hypothetical protein